MSATKFYKTASFAAMAVAGMTLTACASDKTNSRYGNVYDYESGGNCAAVSSCAPAPVVTQAYTQPVYTQPTYTQPTYTQPTYTQPTYTQPSAPTTSFAGPIECPAGTIDSGDGTCAQVSSSSSFSSSTTTSYGSGDSFSSSPSTSTSYGISDSYTSDSFSSSSSSSFGSGSSYSGGAINCPAGTTDAGDGTCAQNSSTSYGSGSSSSYGSDSSSTYSGGDVTIYSGDASPSGYTSSTTSSSSVYLPIRK